MLGITDKYRLPNAAYFPFEFIDVRVPAVGKFTEAEMIDSGTTLRIVKNKDNVITTSGVEPLIAKPYPMDMATTLQYGQGNGNVAFLEFVKQHIKVAPSFT